MNPGSKFHPKKQAETHHALKEEWVNLPQVLLDHLGLVLRIPFCCENSNAVHSGHIP